MINALDTTLRDAAKFFLRPRKFIAHQTIDRRRQLHRILRAFKRGDYKARNCALAALRPDRPLAAIPETEGMRWVDDLDPKVVAAAVSAGLALKDNLDFNHMLARAESKHLVSTQVPIQQSNDPILALALHPAFVKMIGNYIGTLPILFDALFMYSPNLEDIAGTSQHYHLDAQDVRTVIVYLFLHDIESDGGPFIALTAAASERVARQLGYRKTGRTQRVTDSVVEPHIAPHERRIFTGPAGSLFVCDTDRCLHYGSRSATRPRYVVALHYVSPAAFAIAWNYKNTLPYSKLPNASQFADWQRMVLGSG
jgi:hypothetical protein